MLKPPYPRDFEPQQGPGVSLYISCAKGVFCLFGTDLHSGGCDV